jgi:hypothetical protein
LNARDIKRLAAHFDLSPDEAQRKYTRTAHGYDRVMRRKPDEHFGKICRFFDTEKRNCSVYDARPEICRRFPQERSCGYYDFLTWERKHQRDETFVATTQNDIWD